MIGIRKLLDLVFTRRELKILDDIMPETTKPTIPETKEQSARHLENGSEVGFCKKSNFQHLCDGTGLDALLSKHSKSIKIVKDSPPIPPTPPPPPSCPSPTIISKDSTCIPEVEIRLLN